MDLQKLARFSIGTLIVAIATLPTMFSPLTSDAFWGGSRTVMIWEEYGFWSFLEVIIEYFYSWERPQLGGLANYFNWGIAGQLAQLLGTSWSEMLWLTNLILIVVTLGYLSKLTEGLIPLRISTSQLFLVFSIGLACFFSTNALIYHDPFSMNTAASLSLFFPIISYMHFLNFEKSKSMFHLFLVLLIAIISINSSEANYPGVLLILLVLALSIKRNYSLFKFRHLAILISLLCFALLNMTYWIRANLHGNPANYSGTQSSSDLILILKAFFIQIFTSLPIVSGLIQRKNSENYLSGVVANTNPSSPIDFSLLTIPPLLLAILILLSLHLLRSHERVRNGNGNLFNYSKHQLIFFAILSVFPMLVIAGGSKYQVELLSEFTYYVGAPLFCVTVVILILFVIKDLNFLTSKLSVLLIVSISVFQLTQNLESVNTISAKFSYLKVVQLAFLDPNSIPLSKFCNSKDEVVRRDYAGLGEITGINLEKAYFRKNPSQRNCPR